MTFSRLISILFHPIFMPLLGVFLLLQSGTWLSTITPEAKLHLYLVTVSISIILPLIILYLLKTLGHISDLKSLDVKEKRSWLMILSFCALLSAFILQKVSAPLIIALFFNGISILLLVCALISFKWKISAHLVCLGGLVGLLLAISFKWMLDLRVWLAVAFIISSVVAMTRLHSKTHNPLQIYSGFGLGIVSIFLLLFLI